MRLAYPFYVVGLVVSVGSATGVVGGWTAVAAFVVGLAIFIAGIAVEYRETSA